MPMINSEALLRALPVSALEPNVVARLIGWSDDFGEPAAHRAIKLLEPPCCQREPYLDPAEAIEVLRKHAGLQGDTAATLDELRNTVAVDRWVYFLDIVCPTSRGCLRVSDFVAAPAIARYLTSEIAGFLLSAAAEAAKTPMFVGPDNRGRPWSLETL